MQRHTVQKGRDRFAVRRRTGTLLPNVIELLKTRLPLHVGPEDYVFIDSEGKPIDQSEFARKFQDVLRVLEIRPRPFYNTRHTFISVALTLGCNQKWIAEQTGTSIAMIQENYGKYIRDDGDVLLRAYVATTATCTQPSQEIDVKEVETETFTETFSDKPSNSASFMASPTGFEPVSPA